MLQYKLLAGPKLHAKCKNRQTLMKTEEVYCLIYMTVIQACCCFIRKVICSSTQTTVFVCEGSIVSARQDEKLLDTTKEYKRKATFRISIYVGLQGMIDDEILAHASSRKEDYSLFFAEKTTDIQKTVKKHHKPNGYIWTLMIGNKKLRLDND